MVGQHSFQPDSHFYDLVSEFERKNEILRQRFLQVDPEDYLTTIFPDKKKLLVILGTQKDKKGNITERGTVLRVDTEDIWTIAWRPNAYLTYVDFWKNYYSSKTLKAVRAFVVDCDGVSSIGLTKILKYGLSSLSAQPTHIVNSGKGFHFIYALSKPVEVKGLRKSLNALNSAIQESFEAFIDVDKHPLFHPYRFPGFQTKINTVATAFKLREPYTVEELMEKFKIKKSLSKATKKEKKQEKEQAQIFYFPTGKRAFFEWVLKKLFKTPPIPGRRHNSFFALGIISYKCRREVPEEEAREAVLMVYEDMMRKNLHIGFSIDEAYEAFDKGYQQKYVRAGWKFLSELLGFEYRPNKRNGRTRKEHVKFMNRIRLVRCQSRWEELEEHIKRLIDKGYKKSEIAEMVGISRITLWRRFKHLWK